MSVNLDLYISLALRGFLSLRRLSGLCSGFGLGFRLVSGSDFGVWFRVQALM